MALSINPFIPLARASEESLRLPFALALILIAYTLNLILPGQFELLDTNFDEIVFLMLPMIRLLGLTVREIRGHMGTFLYLALFAVCASIALAVTITPFIMPDYAFTSAMLMTTDAITVSSLFNEITALIIFYFIALPLNISGILATTMAILVLRLLISRETAVTRLMTHQSMPDDANSYYDLIRDLLRRVPALTQRGFMAHRKEAHYVGLFANAIVFISMANLLSIRQLLEHW